jgi:hypothetical protein
MGEHTPLPWHFDELEHRPDGCGYIRHESDRFEISHHGDTGRSREENLANAAFIVKAVNNHDALVAEVEKLREAMKGAAIVANTAGSLLKEKDERIDALVKALEEILSAEKEFREGMPEGWEGDPLTDACAAAREALEKVAT